MAVDFEPLNPSHDRRSFECGLPALDRYFREQAGQDRKRRLANCFVAVDGESRAVMGFYTLAASSVPLTALSDAETRRLPRYQAIPAALIGRLAVDLRYRGRQVGAALLADALGRAARAEAAAMLMLVDAKDPAAADFYRKHGFMPLESRPLSLFLPIATILKLAD